MKVPRLAVGGESRVEMIPLIDVVFLVLVAFIYASAFLAPKTGIPVDLPVASEGQTQDDSVLTVSIARDGSLYLDKQPIQLNALSRAFVQAKRANADTTVYIKADKKAQLDALVQVMDSARRAELSGLTIATRRPARESEQTATEH